MWACRLGGSHGGRGAKGALPVARVGGKSGVTVAPLSGGELGGFELYCNIGCACPNDPDAAQTEPRFSMDVRFFGLIGDNFRREPLRR